MAWSKEVLVHELTFWLEIMHEHTILILSGLPCEEASLRHEAVQLSKRFDELQSKAGQPGIGRELEAFIPEVHRAVRELISFKKKVLDKLVHCEIHGLFPIMLDHVIREAEHFLMHLAEGTPRSLHHDVLEAEAFWLRIMSEHMGLLNHFLDPSQQSLNRKAYLYEDLFLRLHKQAVDFAGMAARTSSLFPAADHFTSEVIMQTKHLIRFKETVYRLLDECKAFALVPALFAEHIKHEAEYFLGQISGHELP